MNIRLVRYLADLHVHSRFSRATSRDLTLAGLHASAQRKGIVVVGTGDFTHPAWRAELRAQLVEAEPGLLRLRDDLAREADRSVPAPCRGPVRFVLQTEISTIYKAGGRSRKVHHVVLAPGIEAAERLSAALARVGNLASDGRPILGLDSRDLLEIVLESGSCLVPAHIWTPWFSALGSRSGFDSIDECYRDLSSHIFAVETGLSSDPSMNWRLTALDRFALVSNSDAHSPAKLGRECNLFDTDLSYGAMLEALRTRRADRFLGTVEFFPQEGKYHLDGHRKCGTRMAPQETRATSEACPVCGRPVTVGVMHRVEELADQPDGRRPAGSPGYRSMVGLAEAIGHAIDQGSATRGVIERYEALLSALGPELLVLESSDLGQVERVAGAVVAEVLRRIRAGEVAWEAGYDGEYGTVTILTKAEREALLRQTCFFVDRGQEERSSRRKPERTARASERQAAPRSAPQPTGADSRGNERQDPPPPDDELLAGLGAEQLAAVLAPASAPILIIAGPGTGKTRTLTTRIAQRVRTGALAPDGVIALTFTNRAATEMRERLASLLAACSTALTVTTFHALGLRIVRDAGLARHRVLEESERLDLVEQAIVQTATEGGRPRRSRVVRVADSLSRRKSGGEPQADEELDLTARAYERLLEAAAALDFDDLVLKATELLERATPPPPAVARLQAVYVDEYQDLNLAQLRMLHALVGPGVELCAIGDPDQAIYAFRGAVPERLLAFSQDWPGASTLTLGRCYRSSDTILSAASQVIAHCAASSRPRLWSGIPGEPHVLVSAASNERGEAERVALLIERLLGGTSLLAYDTGAASGHDEPIAFSFADVAVLYRLRAQAEPVAEALRRAGFPYQVAGGESPWRTGPEMARLLAALRLIAGRASDDDRSLLEPCTPETLDSIGRAGGEESAAQALERAIRAVGPHDGSRQPELTLLRSLAEGLSGGAAGLLDRVALQGEVDVHDPRADAVALLTLHASKGLEWPVAIILGCEEGLVPYARPGEEPSVEEERRLFYVGMTRARRLLVLSRARERRLHGRGVRLPPSRFLLDVEQRLKQADQGARPGGRRPDRLQLGLFRS